LLQVQLLFIAVTWMYYNSVLFLQDMYNKNWICHLKAACNAVDSNLVMSFNKIYFMLYEFLSTHLWTCLLVYDWNNIRHFKGHRNSDFSNTLYSMYALEDFYFWQIWLTLKSKVSCLRFCFEWTDFCSEGIHLPYRILYVDQFDPVDTHQLDSLSPPLPLHNVFSELMFAFLCLVSFCMLDCWWHDTSWWWPLLSICRL
jgi:hypothetical protein